VAHQDLVPQPLRCNCRDGEVRVVAGDWGAVARALTRERGATFACLNMANAYVPGGGYTAGKAAQEENMFRRTDCHFTLDRAAGVVRPPMHAAGGDDPRGAYTAARSALLNGAGGRVLLDTATPRVCVRGPERAERADLGYEWLADDDVFPFFEVGARRPCPPPSDPNEDQSRLVQSCHNSTTLNLTINSQDWSCPAAHRPRSHGVAES
jgi:hypothetical protein